MSSRTPLRVIAVLVPLLMLAASLPTSTGTHGTPGLHVYYERPDQSVTELNDNPPGWDLPYRLGYPVGTDGTQGLATFVVHNGGTATIDTLSFKIRRDRGEDPADDVQDDDSYIEFIQSTSKSVGWETTVRNGDGTGSDNENLLTYTYKTGGSATQLGVGTSWKFDVGYRVHLAEGLDLDAEDPYRFRVEVHGTYSGGGLAPLYTFNFTVDPTPPKLVSGDAEDAPVPVLTRDLDGNGHLDQVILTFDDLLDTRSFVLKHFRVNNREPVQADYEWYAPGEDIIPSEPQYGKCPAVDGGPHWGCTQVILTIDENQHYDTGERPFITHGPLGDSLADLASNEVQSFSTQAADGAAPVLVGALARSVDSIASNLEAVLLTFSEPIKLCEGCGDRLAATDFAYTDTASSSVSHQAPDAANPGQYLDYPLLYQSGTDAADNGVEHTAGQYVVLVFRNDKGEGEAEPLTTSDAPAVPPEVALAAGSADTVACRAAGAQVRIVDLADKPIPCRTVGALKVPVLSATIVEAATDISSQEVRLRFNAPVESVNSGAITAGLGAFDVVGTQSGGVLAVVGVEHQRCTDTVILTIQNQVLPTDVDDTPAKIVVESGKVQACTQRPGNTPVVVETLSPSPIPLTDTTPPEIIALKTVDLDANGAIDGLQVTFSEPVRDLSFCGGSNPCPIGGMVALHVRDSATANFYALDGYGPFTFDTRTPEDPPGAGKNDDRGLIRWPQNDPAPAAANALLTGYIPDLEVQAGLFEDLAPLTQPPNPMERLTREEVFETDGAAPVLLGAETMDTDTGNATVERLGFCEFNPAREALPNACRLAPNGYLDGYMLRFSEPIVDASLNVAEWTVQGYEIEPVKPKRKSMRSWDGANDEMLFLPFFEKKEEGGRPIYGDTGALPQITYRALSATGGLRDASGNHMNPRADFTQLDVGPEDVEEQDGAAPVIVNATGFIGQNWVRVHFSEPVDDGQDGALVRSDFVWRNLNLGGAGGITISPQVDHEAGGRTAIVYLNAPLAEADMEKDAIAAFADDQNSLGSIYETSTKVEERRYVSGRFVPIQNATDLTPPGNVTDLNHTFIDADRIYLEWIAPSEDGEDRGTGAPKVDHYAIKVSTEHIAAFKGSMKAPTSKACQDLLDDDVHDLPKNVAIAAFDPCPLVAPGQTQGVQITGLKPDTKYYFAVVAVDEEGLVSPAAAVVTVSTNQDRSPPIGDLAPRVKASSKVGGKVVDLSVGVEWDKAEDPQTQDVRYHFRFSQDQDLEITADDQHTLNTEVTVTAHSRGTWYFHVRPFSGVPGEQRILEVQIVAPPVDEDEAIDYVYLFNDPAADPPAVKAVRKGDVTTVNWTLPENPPGEIVALQIWRHDGIEWVLAGEVTGDYTSLRHGEFKDTNGTAASRYFVTPVYDGAQGFDPQEQDVPTTLATPVSETDGLAWYWWLVIFLGLVLLAGAVVLVVVLRGRAEAVPLDPDHQEGWSDVSQEGALPVHEIDCPSCQARFQATGHLPLPITCPECGISGKLE